MYFCLRIFLQIINGQLSFLATNRTSSDVLSLAKGASGFGSGAIMGDSWFQGNCSPSWGLQTHFHQTDFANRTGCQAMRTNIE